MIIKANMKHINDIIKIENISYNKPWSKLHFIQDINNNKLGLNYVSIKKNRVIGFLFGDIVDLKYHLNNIAVHPDFRRNDIANKLFQYLINILKESGIKRIFLEIDKKNFSARNLYEKLGFIKVNVSKDYYSKGNDAVLYNLEII